jgi:hypothetical protein
MTDMNDMTDFGYDVLKYCKNDGFYKFHTDFLSSFNKKELSIELRKISFIWYLNDVEEGGETEFFNGKIKPEAGKLLFFPSNFNYVHRGNLPISDDKYIIVGWLGEKKVYDKDTGVIS